MNQVESHLSHISSSTWFPLIMKVIFFSNLPQEVNMSKLKALQWIK